MTEAATAASAATWLFVPGDRPDRFAKAAAAGADLVVLDLEDAVAAQDKDTARSAVANHLRDGGAGVVRVNAVGTAPHDADVEAIAGAPGLRAVMVPMADSATALSAVARATGAPVVALVETADAVLRARELAGAVGVERLALDAIDLCLDIDAVEEDRTLLFARSGLVFASRAAGIAAPVDGVTVDSGGEVAGADATAARRLGFGGKLCIHPRQIAAVAEAFAPSEKEVAWARRIVEAVSASAGDSGGSAPGAVLVDGAMVDKPVVDRARRILDRAGETSSTTSDKETAS